MSKTTAVILTVLSVAVVWSFTVPDRSLTAAPGDGSRATWEHMAVTHNGAEFDRELSQQIVRFGDEGWELVDVETVVSNGETTKTVFFFKRPQ